MFLSCSLFMADGSHLRRIKLTVDRRMKQSMWSMIVAGLPITQELAQEKQLAWPSAPANQIEKRKCCKWPRCHIYRQVWTYAMETKNTIFQRSWESESWKTKKKLEKTKKTQKKKNPEVLVDRGVQPRVPKYCFFLCFLFFLVFSRFFCFFWVFSLGPLPKESPNIVFFVFLFFLFSPGFFFLFSPWGLPPKSPQILFFVYFFWFSRGFFFGFLHGASPQRIPKFCCFFLFFLFFLFFVFFGFLEVFFYFFCFSPWGLSPKSPHLNQAMRWSRRC